MDSPSTMRTGALLHVTGERMPRNRRMGQYTLQPLLTNKQQPIFWFASRSVGVHCPIRQIRGIGHFFDDDARRSYELHWARTSQLAN
jgi:hypothetical protein